MTETEAKTKWCPMVRSLAFNAVGACAANQAYSDEVVDLKLAYCKGSACMMWRSRIVPVPFNDQNRDPQGNVIRERIDGYCGLAGQPV